MQTLKKTAQKGFTIIELLIVIAIIAILALLVLNNFQGAQAKARDSQRRTDINNVHAKLEEFYNEKSGYPNENLTTTLLPGMDAGSLKDSDDNDMQMSFDTAATAPASTVANTTKTSKEYQYAAFSCANATSTADATCGKYTLRSYVEKPSSSETSNTYVKNSLN